jgi:hypothetical protein
MPLYFATDLGKDFILSGSTIPSVGLRNLEAIPVLDFVGISSNILTPVVSLPVPAVVGMAINGVNAPGTGRPSPKGGLTYA